VKNAYSVGFILKDGYWGLGWRSTSSYFFILHA